MTVHFHAQKIWVQGEEVLSVAMFDSARSAIICVASTTGEECYWAVVELLEGKWELTPFLSESAVKALHLLPASPLDYAEVQRVLEEEVQEL